MGHLFRFSRETGRVTGLFHAVEGAAEALEGHPGLVAYPIDQNEMIPQLRGIGIDDVMGLEVSRHHGRCLESIQKGRELRSRLRAEPAALGHLPEGFGIPPVSSPLGPHHEPGTIVGVDNSQKLLEKPGRLAGRRIHTSMLPQFPGRHCEIEVAPAGQPDERRKMRRHFRPHDFDQKRRIIRMNKHPALGPNRDPRGVVEAKLHGTVFSQAAGRVKFVTLACLALLLGSAPALAGPCAAEITRFQKLIDGDLKTGFIGKEVHAKASADLVQANALCKAGKDSDATSSVRATRLRYGYPPGSNQNLPQ